MRKRKWQIQTIDRQLKCGTAKKSEINVKRQIKNSFAFDSFSFTRAFTVVIEKASLSHSMNNEADHFSRD